MNTNIKKNLPSQSLLDPHFLLPLQAIGHFCLQNFVLLWKKKKKIKLVCVVILNNNQQKKTYLVIEMAEYLKVYNLLFEYLKDIDKLLPNDQHLVHHHVLAEHPPKVWK